MFWPHWKYVEYVTKNAGPVGARELLEPPAEPIDPSAANVVVGFHPMPDWMAWYDLTIDDGAFRLFRHRFETEIKTYKDKVRRQFQPIVGSGAGRALMAEFGRIRPTVKLRPYWNWDDPINADTLPRSLTHPDQEDYEDALARGERGRRNGKRIVGTGRGANSVIGYSPEMWGQGGTAKAKGPANEPDAIIFHESIHATRQMRGVQENWQVRGYDNVEEYIAIVITNIYLSEKGETNLLGGHDEKALRDPEKFLDNYQHIDLPPRELMQKFKAAQQEFFRDLAGVSARFNPVAQYEKEQRAGRTLAATMLGDGR